MKELGQGERSNSVNTGGFATLLGFGAPEPADVFKLKATAGVTTFKSDDEDKEEGE